MKTVIQEIADKSAEQVIIACTEVTQEIRNLQAHAESVGNSIAADLDGKQVNVSLDDILYFEAVDEQVFVYLASDVGRVRGRLYEYEERLSDRGFVRVSKSVLLHLRMVRNISPALGRKFIAELTNGEQVIISRQYIKTVREILLGGKINAF